MTDRLRHRGGVSAERGSIRVRTIICDLPDAEDGVADAEVNEFCEQHDVVSIVLDRFNAKMIYRILYRNED